MDTRAGTTQGRAGLAAEPRSARPTGCVQGEVLSHRTEADGSGLRAELVVAELVLHFEHGLARAYEGQQLIHSWYWKDCSSIVNWKSSTSYGIWSRSLQPDRHAALVCGPASIRLYANWSRAVSGKPVSLASRNLVGLHGVESLAVAVSKRAAMIGARTLSCRMSSHRWPGQPFELPSTDAETNRRRGDSPCSRRHRLADHLPAGGMQCADLSRRGLHTVTSYTAN